MHEQELGRLSDPGNARPSELLLKVLLQRGADFESACLFLVHDLQYAELARRPELVLHAQELRYFNSLSALKRKKDFLLGRYAAKRALHDLSHTDSAPAILQTGSAPAIHIRSGVFQQPVVSGPGCEQLSVCITHSGSIAAAIAFPTGHPLGIDIEWHDNALIETLSNHISAHELPPAQWCASEAERYTRVWTIKESLSKILQCGLTTPFRIFNLQADPVSTPGVWQGGFENFAQYRFISLGSQRLSFALVHPGRTTVIVPLQQIINFAD